LFDSAWQLDLAESTHLIPNGTGLEVFHYSILQYSEMVGSSWADGCITSGAEEQVGQLVKWEAEWSTD